MTDTRTVHIWRVDFGERPASCGRYYSSAAVPEPQKLRWGVRWVVWEKESGREVVGSLREGRDHTLQRACHRWYGGEWPEVDVTCHDQVLSRIHVEFEKIMSKVGAL